MNSDIATVFYLFPWFLCMNKETPRDELVGDKRVGIKYQCPGVLKSEAVNLYPISPFNFPARPEHVVGVCESFMFFFKESIGSFGSLDTYVQYLV